jgi:hypothetical protein
MFGEVDKSQHGLIELPATERTSAGTPRHVILQGQPLERMASGKIARRRIRDTHPELAAVAAPAI